MKGLGRLVRDLDSTSICVLKSIMYAASSLMVNIMTLRNFEKSAREFGQTYIIGIIRGLHGESDDKRGHM